MAQQLPSAPFPILTSVSEVREWRAARQAAGEQVGFVPTMGALHDGHLSLVRASLLANEATVISIFVNPAQFAPHEDLATYPRTIEADIAALASLTIPVEGSSSPRTVSALFLPPISALYPSGIDTDVSKQRGTFLEVKGLQEVMEGVSRPGFFRGVATVVIKLFNIIQPTKAYFGQKDIQQALLLRRMLTDLHVPAPLASNLVIIPTYRDAASELALSSRNAYLRAEERPWATVLIDALHKAQQVWDEQKTKGAVVVKDVLEAARASVRAVEKKAQEEGKGVEVRLIYVALNDPDELWDLEKGESAMVPRGKGAVLSGAVMLGRTRLIDNLVFDYPLN
ncbi:pantoate-beta-alanine ligase [Leucosporidium creatinivorum]|uniref:Pantoate--beta-alanine ligase n=1 Tax=Leucosporidium creatinivorum TaxID=106004 RepID=A0A1Y2EY32_9BASI|nr:pantoate-beta-alanine ligase [Leucosporidium creatinivorum]